MQIKRKFLRSWRSALASSESGDREEIVIDWFADLKLEDVEEEGVEKQDVTKKDEGVIVLPFFSHEVFSLSELPEKERDNGHPSSIKAS